MAYKRSGLSGIVEGAARRKNLQLESYAAGKLRDLEKRLDNQKEVPKDDIRKAYAELKAIFGRNFEDYEYREMGNDLSRNLLNRRIF